MKTIKSNDRIKQFIQDEWFNELSNREERLANLKSKWSSNDGVKNFLDLLISNFTTLIIGEIDKLHSEIITKTNVNFDITRKRRNNKGIEIDVTLKEDILNALDYKGLRNKKELVRKMMSFIGVKACPYCNAHLTIVTHKSNKAKFELDHFFPKDKYSYLSISFYNLMPCCGNCNRAKLDKETLLDKHFYLYERGIANNILSFDFNLEDASIIEYLFHKNKDLLEVVLNNKGNEANLLEHNKRFHVTDIYNTQKDVAEELIWKKQAYSKAKKEELLAIQGLFPDEATFNRILLGNYHLEEDIHKRPLAKFTQDIAKQLGLI